MNFIADSNVLFTFFWKKSISKKLFINQDLKLFTPKFALEEIKKYSEMIIKKTKISKEEFSLILKELKVLIKFVPLEIYQSNLKIAKKICIDPNDVDFVALSIKINCPLWSNDSVLKEIKNIQVFNTKEIIEILD